MLSKISAAWQWTVCRRIGLFAADQLTESPLSAFSDNRSPPTPPNVAPHDIWIKFLVRRFEVIKYYSRDQVRDRNVFKNNSSANIWWYIFFFQLCFAVVLLEVVVLVSHSVLGKRTYYFSERILSIISRNAKNTIVQRNYEKKSTIYLNPFTPSCDQDRIPPYNINTISII